MLKFRLYYDKDAEQDWLTKMSNRGYAFKNYFLGFYTFEECEPGKYLYQIDLIDDKANAYEEFCEFMKESGVDIVARWYRWVYLRKAASEGVFEMYTDNESKINQYTRIRKFFSFFLILEIICFFVEINAAIQSGKTIFWVFTLLIGVIALAFLRITWKCSWKIEQLRRD